MTRHSRGTLSVIPAKAGIFSLSQSAELKTIPAFAGMTEWIKTKTVGVSRHRLWFLVCNRMGG
jgi:hypothetical protein